MDNLLLVAAAGFAASMVDGALGMGFGPTSSTLLLSGGMAPAAVSATVNLAKVAAGLAAGVSHWRFGNIDKRLVARLAFPGAAGAVVGTTVLSRVDGRQLRPWLATLLLLVGVRILVRFRKPLPGGPQPFASDPGAVVGKERGASWAGAAGGVTNGLIGAWGPVVTPFLLHRGVPPRTAVGSVNTAEVAVAAVAFGTLIPTMRAGGLDAGVAIAMLLGGVGAAPLAAWLVRLFPPRAMGVAVAALLLLTSARDLLQWRGIGSARWIVYALICAAASLAGLAPRLSARRRPPGSNPAAGLVAACPTP